MDIPGSTKELRSLFEKILDSEEKRTISFINPEILIEAFSNKSLKAYLIHSDYNIVDGIGILKAINYSQKTKYRFTSRFPGTDFFDYLPQNRKIRVFLYGANKKNNAEAAKLIEQRYRHIQIVGRQNGYANIEENKLVSKINQADPDIIIVCLGCPRQEKWIEANRKKLNYRLVFGNGGSIDFWSGGKKRAPEFFIKHGIEWIYRLFQDFTIKRIRRQVRLIPFYFKSLFCKWDIRKAKRVRI